MHVAAPPSWVSLEDLVKHYGPGPHPGTGSPQAVHRPGSAPGWTPPKDAKEVVARLKDQESRGRPLWNPTGEQVAERLLNNYDHEFRNLMWARQNLSDGEYGNLVTELAEFDGNYWQKGLWINGQYQQWQRFMGSQVASGQPLLSPEDALDVMAEGFKRDMAGQLPALRTNVLGTLTDEYGSLVGEVMSEKRFAQSIDTYGLPDAVVRSEKVFMGDPDGWQKMDEVGVAAAYFDRSSNGISMLTLGPRDPGYVDDDHAYIPTADNHRTIAFSPAQGRASVAQTVRHEYGHHVWFSLPVSARREFTQSYRASLGFGVSRYAATGDPVEAFAEMFSLVTHPKWSSAAWRTTSETLTEEFEGTPQEQAVRLAHETTVELMDWVEEVGLYGPGSYT